MARRYSAFVLRHWQLADGREQVEFQDIATGERHRFGTLAAAYTWLAEAGRASPVPAALPIAREPAAPDEPP